MSVKTNMLPKDLIDFLTRPDDSKEKFPQNMFFTNVSIDELETISVGELTKEKKLGGKTQDRIKCDLDKSEILYVIGECYGPLNLEEYWNCPTESGQIYADQYGGIYTTLYSESKTVLNRDANNIKEFFDVICNKAIPLKRYKFRGCTMDCEFDASIDKEHCNYRLLCYCSNDVYSDVGPLKSVLQDEIPGYLQKKFPSEFEKFKEQVKNYIRSEYNKYGSDISDEELDDEVQKRLYWSDEVYRTSLLLEYVEIKTARYYMGDDGACMCDWILYVPWVETDISVIMRECKIIKIKDIGGSGSQKIKESYIMNTINNEILSAIDNIDECVMEAEAAVFGAMSDLYTKTSIIFEECNRNCHDSAIFQEGILTKIIDPKSDVSVDIIKIVKTISKSFSNISGVFKRYMKRCNRLKMNIDKLNGYTDQEIRLLIHDNHYVECFYEESWVRKVTKKGFKFSSLDTASQILCEIDVETKKISTSYNYEGILNFLRDMLDVLEKIKSSYNNFNVENNVIGATKALNTINDKYKFIKHETSKSQMTTYSKEYRFSDIQDMYNKIDSLGRDIIGLCDVMSTELERILHYFQNTIKQNGGDVNRLDICQPYIDMLSTISNLRKIILTYLKAFKINITELDKITSEAIKALEKCKKSEDDSSDDNNTSDTNTKKKSRKTKKSTTDSK